MNGRLAKARLRDMFPRCLGLLLLGVSVAWSAPELPADFHETYQVLAGLIDREALGPMDMARGTYDATRFFAVGAAGVPPLEERYRKAATLGQASVAGLYLTVWGRQRQFDLIRAELERNEAKRRMIYGLCGTEPLFFSALESGANYQPLLRLMPSVGGTRTLTRQLLDSSDALVRRSGLFWGFWLADAAFWKRVKDMAQSDPDPVTRRVSARLLQKAATTTT